MKLPQMLTLRECAEVSRLSRDHVRRLAASGRLPGARRPGGIGDWRIDAEQFQRWLDGEEAV